MRGVVAQSVRRDLAIKPLVANEEMADDITKIKEAIYNPDQGIYSRLKELEAWKSSVTRVLWLLATGALGSFGVTLWEILKKSCFRIFRLCNNFPQLYCFLGKPFCLFGIFG